jgi:hypothetical protein
MSGFKCDLVMDFDETVAPMSTKAERTIYLPFVPTVGMEINFEIPDYTYEFRVESVAWFHTEQCFGIYGILSDWSADDPLAMLEGDGWKINR